MLLIVILLLILVAVLGVFRALLHGTLTLNRVNGEKEEIETVELPLPPRPWLLRPADDLIGVPGWIFIAGIPFTRRMHVWIRCPKRLPGDGTLRPGGRRYVSGVWVIHDTSEREDNTDNQQGYIDSNSIGW